MGSEAEHSRAKPKSATGEKWVVTCGWMTGGDGKLLNGVADVCGKYVGPTDRDFRARTAKQRVGGGLDTYNFDHRLSSRFSQATTSLWRRRWGVWPEVSACAKTSASQSGHSKVVILSPFFQPCNLGWPRRSP